MSIIDSIYESTGAFSIHVKDTDKVFLLRNGEIDSIVHIQKVGELWKENLDCKIFTSHLFNLNSVSKGLQLSALVCFDFMDKHVFILNSIAMQSITKDTEYTLIPKELMTEIKGGAYGIDKEMLETMETPLTKSNI